MAETDVLSACRSKVRERLHYKVHSEGEAQSVAHTNAGCCIMAMEVEVDITLVGLGARS